jgi:Bacterial Ig domain/G8 domain
LQVNFSRNRARLLGIGVFVLLAALGYLVVSSLTRSPDGTSAGSGQARTAAKTGKATGTEVVSVRSGDWTDPAVWDRGRPPGDGDSVVISAADKVNFDAELATVAGLSVRPGATLAFDPGKSVTLQSSRNVVVRGVLAMKPGDPSIRQVLRFVGVDEASFVGGGMDPIPSDVGLWVVGDGLLDAQGADKTDWTHAAGAVPGGASRLDLEAAPDGWRVGDEVAVAPTEPPSAGEASWSGFDEASLTTVSGAAVGLSKATARPHPLVDGRWKAEVMNLTRNVRIEGTAHGRAHVFLRSTRPQVIRNVALRYMGPRQAGEEGGSEPVKGRYALHFHHAMDASRGSVVSGTVVRDAGSHAFVAHTSHGVTFDSTVSYNTFDEAYWWDQPTRKYPDPPDSFSNDIVYRNAVAARVHADPDSRGYRLSGFFLGTGLRNVVRGCVAVGVVGNGDASGFIWPEVSGVEADGGANDGANSWLFDNNVAHNNKRHGIFTWQNNPNDHVVNNFLGYYNSGNGVKWGAYTNRYHFVDNVLYGNGESQFFAWATGRGLREHRFDGFQLVGSRLDAAHQSDYALSLAARSVVESDPADPDPSGIIQGNVFAGYRKAAVNLSADELDNNPYPNQWLLVDNLWKDPDRARDFLLTETPGSRVPGAAGLTVDDRRHGAISLGRAGAPRGVPNRAWNARVTRRPSGADRMPPLLSLLQPGFGDTQLDGGFRLTGRIDIGASIDDNVRVAKAELLIDGALQAADARAPYAWSWDPASAPRGSTHTIVVRAHDASGNVSQTTTKVIIGGGR